MVSDEDRTPCSECAKFIWLNVFKERGPVPGCITGKRDADEIDRDLLNDLELGRDRCSDFERRG